MDSEGSLPSSQVPTTCPYSGPARSSPYPHFPRLLTAIGLIHVGSSTVHIYSQTIHRTTQLTRTTQFTTEQHFLKIHLNILLPSTPWSLKCFLSLAFPHQNPVYAFPIQHTCYMPRPSLSLDFVLNINLLYTIQLYYHFFYVLEM